MINGMKKISKYKFSEICSRIEDIIYKYFDKNVNPSNFNRNLSNDETNTINLDERKFTMFLSNGDILNYHIDKNNLAHLLGINTDYLITKGIYSKDESSFDILEKIIRNPDKLYSKYEQNIININEVVSDYIERKLDSFETNAFMDFNSILWICKYDNNRTYSFKGNYDISYYVVHQKDDKYYLLLISEIEKNKYVPISNQSFDSYEELIDSLSDKIIYQELLLSTGLSIKQGYNKSTRLWINSDTKKHKLQTLQKDADIFSCIPNVLNDYLYLLQIFKSNKIEQHQNSDVLYEIASLMASKKPIDVTKMKYGYDITDEMQTIIDAYNDSLFNENNFNETKTYSSVKRENDELKKKLEDTLKEIEVITSEYEELKDKYSDKEKEIEELNKKINEVKKVLS